MSWLHSASSTGMTILDDLLLWASGYNLPQGVVMRLVQLCSCEICVLRIHTGQDTDRLDLWQSLPTPNNTHIRSRTHTFLMIPPFKTCAVELYIQYICTIPLHVWNIPFEIIPPIAHSMQEVAVSIPTFLCIPPFEEMLWVIENAP